MVKTDDRLVAMVDWHPVNSESAARFGLHRTGDILVDNTWTQQTAVVTGASGGIGQAIARDFAAVGAHVIVHAHRNTARAEDLRDEIVESGGRCDVVVADLACERSCERFVNVCWDQFGPLTVWVNNAGVDVLTTELRSAPFEDKLQRLWEVDLRATILMSRQVGRLMVAANGGVIINQAWDQALTGMAGDSGEMFAAIKGAVACFTRSLAKSLAPRVRVNCLAPGWIRTAWGAQSATYWDRRAREESLCDRWGDPTDVAAAALFLASPAAGFITGQVLPVNGGLAGYDNWNPPPPADETT